jgi:hypothetical protein
LQSLQLDWQELYTRSHKKQAFFPSLLVSNVFSFEVTRDNTAFAVQREQSRFLGNIDVEPADRLGKDTHDGAFNIGYNVKPPMGI